MVTTNAASFPRCTAVWAAVTVAVAALVCWLLPTLEAPDLGTLDRALVWVCGCLAALAAGWLWLVTTVVAVAASTGRDPGRGVPAPLRGALLAACGAALVTGLSAPAGATPGRPHEITGLPMPDRASSALAGGALVHSGPLRAPRARTPQVVVVAPGDSLWAIAVRDLGVGATDAEIAVRWQQIYQLNRAAVGPDPDLVQPALRLRMPAG